MSTCLRLTLLTAFLAVALLAGCSVGDGLGIGSDTTGDGVTAATGDTTTPQSIFATRTQGAWSTVCYNSTSFPFSGGSPGCRQRKLTFTGTAFAVEVNAYAQVASACTAACTGTPLMAEAYAGTVAHGVEVEGGFGSTNTYTSATWTPGSVGVAAGYSAVFSTYCDPDLGALTNGVAKDVACVLALASLYPKGCNLSKLVDANTLVMGNEEQPLTSCPTTFAPSAAAYTYSKVP